MKKILSIGHLTYDVTLPVFSFPKENEKIHIEKKEEGAGGPALISALLLAKWDMDVYMAGTVGKDLYGERIKKDLSLNRVNTKYIEENEEYITTYSVDVANEENSSRTLLICDKENEKMKDLELDFEPDIIYLDGYESTLSLKMLKKYSKAISVLDAGKEKKEILELAKCVNYVVCSKGFAESVSGLKFDFENKKTLVEIFQKLESKFKGEIVVTLEENGVLYRLDNKIKLMPAIKVKTKDTLGAGDVFHGAFTYGIANDFDYEKTIKYANIAGTLSTTKMGNYNSIPTLKEVVDVYDEVK